MDSQWEDCSFRIDTLNIILFTAGSLSEGVRNVERMTEVENYDVDAVKSQVGEVLDILSENLDQMLPALPTQGITRYDQCCVCYMTLILAIYVHNRVGYSAVAYVITMDEYICSYSA